MTEHDDVIRLLREGRPQATDLELDEIKQRVRRRAADPSRRNQSMKSRVAILGMLVAGIVFSTAGAGLAMHGSNHTQASVAQYMTPTPTATPCTETATGGGGTGDTGSGSVSSSEAGDCAATPEGGVLPAEAENGPSGTGPSGTSPAGGVAPAEASQTQPTRQEAAATNSQLPFTGFAAIPILLGGLALLTGGLILRRRTNSE
jgi:hypothetical protein